jgi:hypothetical protein
MDLISIGDILQKRLKDFEKNPEKSLKKKGTEYQKQWAFGVKCFQVELNKEREKEGVEPIEFMAVRQKLVALREIDDLRWFFYHCKKYAKTKDKTGKWNSFGKCFFGALKMK